MNQQLLVKMGQTFVLDLTNSFTKAGPMSEAIALGFRCNLRIELIHFTGTFG
ncbi:MAG: hypothetical protein IIC58_09265 [Proteobacteria bacterium]|nr:hypothetical protein [Pseudomonadota bacterium]